MSLQQRKTALAVSTRLASCCSLRKMESNVVSQRQLKHGLRSKKTWYRQLSLASLAVDSLSVHPSVVRPLFRVSEGGSPLRNYTLPPFARPSDRPSIRKLTQQNTTQVMMFIFNKIFESQKMLQGSLKLDKIINSWLPTPTVLITTKGLLGDC